MQVIHQTIVVNDDDIDNALGQLDGALKTAPEGWLVGQKAVSVEQIHPQVVKLLERMNKSDKDRVILGSWLVLSPKEVHAALNGEAPGFWSNEYGWTTRDAATRFELPTVGLALPGCGVPDAQFVPDDEQVIAFVLDGLTPYRLMLIEDFGNQSYDQTPLLFECWAEDFAHAEEQARDAYPGCYVLGSEDGRMLSLMRLREMGFDVGRAVLGEPSLFHWLGRRHDTMQKSQNVFVSFDDAIQDLTLHAKELGMPFEVGSKVWQEGTNHDHGAGFGTVVDTTGSILVLAQDNGDTAEVFANACYPADPRG